MVVSTSTPRGIWLSLDELSPRPLVTFSPNKVLANLQGGAALHRGSGYGPAEINLWPIFGEESGRLMVSRYVESYNKDGSLRDGRPGWPGKLGDPKNNNNKLLMFADDDTLIRLKHIGLPEQIDIPGWYGGLARRSAYGTWPDVFGRGAVALDRTGDTSQHGYGPQSENQYYVRPGR